MIYPKNNIFSLGVGAYIRFITRRNFRTINHNSIDIDKNKSVLLIANHFTWWDGLIFFTLSGTLFKKQFYTMLLESTSRRIPALKYAGGFSIRKRSRDVIQSLNFGAQLLNDPKNMVLIFPQGKLFSNFADDVGFEKGIMKIMSLSEGQFQILFAATFIENFAHKKPTVNIYFKSTANNFNNITELQTAYQQHYDAARTLQAQIVKK